jgi:hypothetical protein
MAFSAILTDYLGEGLASARPATLSIAPSALGLYYATDTTVLSAWNGSAWVTITTGGGGVTSVVIASSAFLNGGTITGTGTISSPALAATGLLGGTIGAQATNIAIGNDLALNLGTLNLATLPATTLLGNGGTAAAIPTGVTIGPGLTLSPAETLQVEPSQLLRTVPFPITGKPPASQKYSLVMTQAGTLLANGGTPQAYIPTTPTATEDLTINTIHSGTVTPQGTIAVNTGGTVTFPSFAAVNMAAGDVLQLVNQGAQDATFADASFSFQFKVT